MTNATTSPLLVPADPFSEIPGTWDTGHLRTNLSTIYYSDYRTLDPNQYKDYPIYFSLAWIFTDRSPTSFMNNRDLQLARTLLESFAAKMESNHIGVLQCVCITTDEIIYSFYLREEYVDGLSTMMRELDNNDELRFEWETALDREWGMYRYMRERGYISFDDFEALENNSAEPQSIRLERADSTKTSWWKRFLGR